MLLLLPLLEDDRDPDFGNEFCFRMLRVNVKPLPLLATMLLTAFRDDTDTDAKGEEWHFGRFEMNGEAVVLLGKDADADVGK